MRPSGEEILDLMRAWLTDDETSKTWLAALHRRCEQSGDDSYARAQLWQVRKELAGVVRSGLLALQPEHRPERVHFEPETLLAAALKAPQALAREHGRLGQE